MTEQEQKEQQAEQEYQAKRKIKRELIDDITDINTAEAEAQKRQNRDKSPFKEWTQLNNIQIENITQLIAINPTAGRIFFFIVKHMNTGNAITLSHKMIQEALGIHKITVSRAVKVLTDFNFVKTYRVGNATAYIANSDVVWKSNSKGHRYAEFDSRVMIAESEQKKKQQKTYTKRFNTVKIITDTKAERKSQRQGHHL